MFKELTRQYRLARDYLPVGLGLSAAMALLVTIVGCVAVLYDPRPEAWPAVGSIVYFGMAVFYVFLLSLTYIGTQGDMCLKSGAVRRRLYPALTLMHMLNLAALLVCGWLWIFAERGIVALFGLPYVPALTIPWYLFPLAAVAVPLLGTWMGSVWAKYGKVAFWIIYFLGFGSILLITQIANVLSGERTGPFADAVRAVAQVVARLPVPGLAVLGAVLVLAMLAHTVALLRKMPASN